MAAPVGMACSIKGKPEVKSGDAWRPLRLLQRLEAGDALRCGAGEEAIVVLFGNGQRYQVGAGAQATVAATSLAGAKMLAAAGGPSARAAKALGGARLGAVMARPPVSHERLTPQSTGWITPGADGNVKLAWTPLAGAEAYSFSLRDQLDDVVWHERTAADKAETAIGATGLQLRRPYVWQLVSFGKSGKPIKSRWGVITFLNAADGDELTQSAAPLLDEAKQNPNDTTPHALLAELYRSYGVYERTLDELEATGDSSAQREAYSQISPAALGRWLLLQDDKTTAPE